MPNGTGQGSPVTTVAAPIPATTPIAIATSAQLVDRVRANINEPFSNDDPQRTDQEIAQWLQDGVLDYISKVPADAIPELIVHETFSGTYWPVSNNYIKLLNVVIDHYVTPTGSTASTLIKEQCKVLDIDEEYFALYAPAWAGAWAKFDRIGDDHVIKAGPNCYSGTVTYIGIPGSISSCNVTFPLTASHEEPIVNYGTAMALAKLNDEDAPRYLERYEMRVAAEQGVKYTRKRKVEKVDPQESV
jgi:hypothetical protein